MTKPRDPEALLSAYLTDGMSALPDRVVDAVLDEVHRTPQRTSLGTRRAIFRTTLAAAAVVAIVVVGGSFYAIGRPTPAPSVDPNASFPAPAPSVAASSAAVSTSPSASQAMLTWSQASLDEDWPAPVRTEAAGGAPVVPILLDVVRNPEGMSLQTGRYDDPARDTETDAYPWIDIHAVSFCKRACLAVSVPRPPDVDPAEQWIAYGIVADDDGDGVADRRFGIDNMPTPDTGGWQHRAWITDLHTGKTVSAVPAGGTEPMVGDTFYETSFPAALNEARGSPSCSHAGPPGWMVGLSAADFHFGGGDTTGGGSTGGAVPAQFYAWASVIVDGQVVATDYAPDAGWLHPSSTAPTSADAVAPPIDSPREAIAAVGLTNPLYQGFQPGDTYIVGASAWLDVEAQVDGWDVTFVCGSGDCSAGCVNRAYANYHVGRDGTVDLRCEWQEGEETSGTPC